MFFAPFTAPDRSPAWRRGRRRIDRRLDASRRARLRPATLHGDITKTPWAASSMAVLDEAHQQHPTSPLRSDATWHRAWICAVAPTTRQMLIERIKTHNYSFSNNHCIQSLLYFVKILDGLDFWFPFCRETLLLLVGQARKTPRLI